MVEQREQDGGIEYFSADDLRLVERHGEVKHYPAGTIIIELGSRQDRLFWVRRGQVHVGLSRLLHRDTVDYVAPGELFGELSYLLQTECATASVAVDDVEILEIEGAEFRRLKLAYPGMAARFFKSLAHSLARRLYIHTQG